MIRRYDTHESKRDASRTSPVPAHTIEPFVIAIAVVELYRASYVDTPPAQMIWKKQKVGSVNKKGNMRLVDEANGNRNFEMINHKSAVFTIVKN